MTKKILYIFVLPLLIAAIHCHAHAAMGPYDWAFTELDFLREEKVEKLNSFLEKMHTKATRVSKDKTIESFFDINMRYFKTQKSHPAPDKITREINMLRANFDEYYIHNYLSFYNFYFISSDGNIFYTIRKGSAINQNIFSGQWANTTIGQRMKQHPKKEIFIDFHFHNPSSEPAAFFVEPIHSNGKLIGWIALQCAINKINSLFTSATAKARTTESFLVNCEGIMLTESLFTGESTILKKHLDDKNIQAKFQDRTGHRMVTDYRGVTALTSFKVVGFMGTQWLVVAKVDRDEITTREYSEHNRYYASKLLQRIRTTPCPPSMHLQPKRRMAHRVDIDEYAKATCGDQLRTWGISTCTGVLATFPKRFGYLAHISNKDHIYGGTETDLLGIMIKNIKGFDITPNERRNISFLVVAPHAKTLPAVLDRLVKEGFLLSQVVVLSCREALSASIYYDCRASEAVVEWDMNDETLSHSMGQALNVDHLLEQIIVN